MPKLKKKGGKKRVIKAWALVANDEIAFDTPNPNRNLFDDDVYAIYNTKKNARDASLVGEKIKRVSIIIEN